ncbi:nitrate regulatory gene2 protein [Cynara cardunculus var. scolymus]|uniref:nitrate regulatory gene2 protein n=1 Tax=Cynara cardunculus var. scolymus TaxID=59895 RepID=UPI000D623BCA|nr:nitrate regulatory gene2 protein [Cynara cardunculus var. scolymus]
MGVSNSKAETCEALRLCKERKKFIKQAIDSRYNLAAAHVVYVQSLRNIGIALRKFAEAEFPLESSSKTPLPSPPQIGCNGATGGDGGGQSGCPSPNVRLSYMKSGGDAVVTVNLNPSKISNNNKVYVDDVESLSFTMSPPPPPPPPSWDYFHPRDGSFRFMGHDGFQVNFNDTNENEQFTETDADLGGFVTPPESVKKDRIRNDQDGHRDGDLVATGSATIGSELNGTNLISKNAGMEESELKNGCLTEEETEDPSEFIAHRAKDFLSSIKEIENYFFRASKSGNEVSKMLEANKIQISYAEARGSSMASSLSLLTCFRRETALFLQEPPHSPKVITWKRSTSSHSSSSNPPGTPANDDNENNFVEEFCMIAGRHSSTLDRLYAWERKLYDEVKASESIRKEYDQTCDQLRHQFAKDLKPHVMDKTRAVAKDLHSRMRVALHTVDTISKRIEKMRDDELQPQLVELIQGLIRMWKSMLECHHAQYIISSLAYCSKISKTGTHHDESKNQITVDLQHEIECFGSSFADLVNSHSSYIESINGWLHNCIIQPKERVKNRRAFSPRRAVAPPIFVICRDWSTGFRNLPSQKLSDAIKDLLAHIRRLSLEELEHKRISSIENREETKNGDVRTSSLSTIHSGLTKVLDRLTNFSEASLKMYEDMKQNTETFGNVYSSYRAPPRAYSI